MAISLYLESVSSALLDAAEWGVGVGNGYLQEADMVAGPCLPSSLLEVGKKHKTGLLGRRQIVECASIVERNNTFLSLGGTPKLLKLANGKAEE